LRERRGGAAGSLGLRCCPIPRDHFIQYAEARASLSR
jgi:hypothetical protein